MADYTHEGRQSLWDGTYRALCGLTLPAKNAEVPFFATTTCPACLKVKNSKKRGR